MALRKHLGAVVLAATTIMATTTAFGGECSPEWTPVGGGLTGVNSDVRALAVYDDGTGSALYAVGIFSQAGGNPANLIARWDGTAWSPLGSGVNSFARSVAVVDDGSGPALYAGGDFTQAGGIAASRVARWDGTAWSPLGAGVSGGQFPGVNALATFDDGSGPALYAAGRFTLAGGSPANRIAKWDGEAWSPLGTGTNGSVSALAVFDDGTGPALYAGGSWSQAGGISATNIAKWDGSAWSPIGTGVNGTVNTMIVFDDGSGPALYVGGNFTQAGGNTAARNLARWDGTAWSPVGAGVVGRVYALSALDDGNGPTLFVGGDLAEAGGNPANIIASWNGAAWSTRFGPGLNNRILALATYDDGTGPAIFAGGEFSRSCERELESIARWGCVSERPCAADANLDGAVDLTDLNLILANFGAQSFCGDTNNDGAVDLADLNAVLASFGTACP